MQSFKLSAECDSTEKFSVYFLLINQLIDPSTVVPDLSIGSGQWRDVAHLDHARHKVRKEGGLAVNVALDLRVGGPIVEELLVRVQKPFVADKVLVVVVLEDCWRLQVQRCQVVVT